MKKSIFTFVFAFAMIFANAQIGKNFATELKALIDADEAAVKGDLIKKEEGKVITMNYFKSKLPLKADIQATEGYKDIDFTIYKYDKPLR